MGFLCRNIDNSNPVLNEYYFSAKYFNIIKLKESSQINICILMYAGMSIKDVYFYALNTALERCPLDCILDTLTLIERKRAQ